MLMVEALNVVDLKIEKDLHHGEDAQSDRREFRLSTSRIHLPAQEDPSHKPTSEQMLYAKVVRPLLFLKHASSKLQIRVAKHNLKLESLKKRHSREIEELKHEIVAQEIEILKHEIDALEIEFGEKKSKLLKPEVERMQMVEALNAVNREIEKDLHHEKKTHKVITEDFDS
ncbi:hypothetical protein GOBAR_AA00067 [Gossypium barbadense]|uniref:Uncharacterized protein n=1 Tax=Gossypium barbadense TaxID=3634 RepID=A0A2P5YY27_GOSBA|nr:hypothetical protein GOBAR_AA00067 [Gossypium barbadense]